MRKYLGLRIFLLAGIFGTLLFAFTQSALPADESSNISDGFSGFLSLIFHPDTAPGAFVHEYIRKIAHFTEYFILGLFTSLYVVIFMPRIEAAYRERIRFSIYSLFAAPIVALIDETIQIFSSRGASVADVWLDVFGFFTSAFIVYTVFYVIKLINEKRISS
ncbi:MAG: VanZ family protein [Clostridia bacterium]|nr:VanZ family protein [Clostridia bacterium]